MRRSLRFAIGVLLPLMTLAIGWQLGARYEQEQLNELSERLELLYTGKTGTGSVLADPEKEVDISLLWGVWRLLIKHYISSENLDQRAMVYGAVGGLTRAVGDPYTTFMTPVENKEFHQSLQGKLEGIGAELTMRNEQVVVVVPLKGSPAEEAGLEPEDVILKVDDVDIAGETLNQVVDRIRGPQGTSVTLTILREGENDLLTLSILRARITIPSTQQELKLTGSGTLGYIQLNQFGDGTVGEVREALRALRAENPKGIILDVRSNGGGYLEGAVEIASMFLSQGKVVTVERRDGEPTNHYVSGRPSDPTIPLAILINEGSASASEILAGALQDSDRAKVIGKQSFGKGTVQEVFDLPGNASVRITIAKWLTPLGHDLGSAGVTPDIEVDLTREDVAAGRDPQLSAAMEWLLDGEDVTAQ